MKLSQLTESSCDVATKDDIEHMSGPEYDKYAKWKADCEDELRRTPLSGKRFTDNEKDFRKTMKQDEGTSEETNEDWSDVKNAVKKGASAFWHGGAKFDKKGVKFSSDLRKPKAVTKKPLMQSETYDDYHGDMSKEEYDKTVKDSEMEYTVWVGGTEVNDYWVDYDEAVRLYDLYKAQGYDDVQLDARIKKDVPQDIPMGIKPIPKEFHGSGINWDEVDESSLPGPDAFQKTRDLKLSLRRDLKKPLIHKPINKPKSGYHSNNATGYAESKAKPDFLDLDKDGDKKEPMKKAGKTKKEVCAKEAYNPETGRDPNVDTTEWDNLIAKAKKKQGISDEEVYFNYGDIGGNIIVNPKSTIEDQIFELLNRYYDISAMEFDPSKIEISEDTINEFGPDEVYTKIGGTTAIANKKTGSIRAHGKIGGATLNVNNHLNKDGSSGQISGSGKIGNTNYNVSSKGHDTSLGLDGNFGGKRIQSQYTSNRVANKGRVNAPGTPIVPNKIDKTSLTHKIDGVNATDKQVVKHLNKSLKSENEFSKKVKEATDADAAAIKDRDDFIKMVSARPKSSNKAIDTIKKIVADKQNMQVKFDDGKMKVDLYTASAVSQVYDAVKSGTQGKLDDMLRTKEGMLRLSNFAFKKFNEAINEGRLDEWFFLPAVGAVARGILPMITKVGKKGLANKGKLAVTGAVASLASKDTDEETPQNSLDSHNQYKGRSNSQTVTASKYENKKVYSKDGELLEIAVAPVIKAVAGQVIGNMVKDKFGKEHDANSPQGKMIINMKKKDPNNKDKDGDGKDDRTGQPTGDQEVKGDELIAQARKDVKKNAMKDKTKGLGKGLKKAVVGAFSQAAQSSGFGNPLRASKYSPEDKAIEMMKEAMNKANPK